MKMTEKNGILYLESGRLELYTPSSYGDGINSMEGEIFHVFGLCPYKFYEKVTDKKPKKVGVLNIPSMIMTYPADVEMNVTDTIWNGIYDYSNANSYTVLEFADKHMFMTKNIIRRLDNVNMFMNMILGTKLDNNIPYNMLSRAWIKNMVMNDNDLGVPSTTIDLIIYELCRYIEDSSKPFGSVFGKNPKMSPVAYRFAGIREVCAANSVFTALAFEDQNSMLDASLNMTQQEKDQKISPLEQIIKF